MHRHRETVCTALHALVQSSFDCGSSLVRAATVRLLPVIGVPARTRSCGIVSSKLLSRQGLPVNIII